MGRSNNQRRRTAKTKGQAFVPAWTKSKARRMSNKQQLINETKKRKKLPYKKIVDKRGKVKARKFSAAPRKGGAGGAKKK